MYFHCMKITLQYYVELISLLISLFLFTKSNKKKYLKLFPYYLLLTLIIELLGEVLNKRKVHNLWLYNFFTTLEFVFYVWVIREIIRDIKVKKIFSIILIAYPSCALVNIVFIQRINHFHSYTYALGCLLIVASCIYYFYELFLMPHSVKLLQQPAFWICSGLLFFYTFTFPIYGLTNFVLSLPKVIIRNLENVIMILNVFLYSMFSIAFLCRIRMPKLSRS